MGRRHLRHPEAIVGHLPRPIGPEARRFVITLVMRSGEKKRRAGGESLEEARRRVAEHFAWDEEDEIESAWVRDVTHLRPPARTGHLRKLSTRRGKPVDNSSVDTLPQVG